MSTNIDSIKRKLLIKYPTFGSVIANIEFQASKDIETAGTDGKVLLYNPKFLDGLSEKQQIFIFAHEICHVAFEHIFTPFRLGFAKPESQFFISARDILQTNFADICLIDDDIINIKAAASLGMSTILYQGINSLNPISPK